MDSGYKIYDFDPDSIPDRAAAAIGRAVLASIQNEDLVLGAISELSGIPQWELGVTLIRATASDRIDILARWSEFVADAGIREELARIIKNLRDANERRNALCHRTMMVDPTDGGLAQARRTSRSLIREKGVVEVVDLSPEFLDDEVRFIKSAGLDLAAFLARYRGGWKRSQPAHP